MNDVVDDLKGLLVVIPMSIVGAFLLWEARLGNGLMLFEGCSGILMTGFGLMLTISLLHDLIDDLRREEAKDEKGSNEWLK